MFFFFFSCRYLYPLPLKTPFTCTLSPSSSLLLHSILFFFSLPLFNFPDTFLIIFSWRYFFLSSAEVFTLCSSSLLSYLTFFLSFFPDFFFVCLFFLQPFSLLLASSFLSFMLPIFWLPVCLLFLLHSSFLFYLLYHHNSHTLPLHSHQNADSSLSGTLSFLGRFFFSLNLS